MSKWLGAYGQGWGGRGTGLSCLLTNCKSLQRSTLSRAELLMQAPDQLKSRSVPQSPAWRIWSVLAQALMSDGPEYSQPRLALVSLSGWCWSSRWTSEMVPMSAEVGRTLRN